MHIFYLFKIKVAPKYEPMSKARVRDAVMQKAAKVLVDVIAVLKDKFEATVFLHGCWEKVEEYLKDTNGDGKRARTE